MLAKPTFILAYIQYNKYYLFSKLFVYYIKANYNDTNRLSNSLLEKLRVR